MVDGLFSCPVVNYHPISVNLCAFHILRIQKFSSHYKFLFGVLQVGVGSICYAFYSAGYSLVPVNVNHKSYQFKSKKSQSSNHFLHRSGHFADCLIKEQFFFPSKLLNSQCITHMLSLIKTVFLYGTVRHYRICILNSIHIYISYCIFYYVSMPFVLLVIYPTINISQYMQLHSVAFLCFLF